MFMAYASERFTRSGRISQGCCWGLGVPKFDEAESGAVEVMLRQLTFSLNQIRKKLEKVPSTFFYKTSVPLGDSPKVQHRVGP